MLRVVAYLILLLLLSAVIAWVKNHPGSVELLWQGYELSTSIAALLAALVALFLLFWTVWSLLARFLALPGWLGHKRTALHREKACDALLKGFASLATGHPDKALKSGQESLKLLRNEKRLTPLAQLLVAESARGLKQIGTATHYYEMLLEHNATEQVAMRGLLHTAEAEGKLPKAIELAERAALKHPGDTEVTLTLLRLYKQAQAWDKAITLLERGKPGWFRSHFVQPSLPLDANRELSRLYLACAHNALAGSGEGDLPSVAWKKAWEAHRLDPSFAASAFLLAELASKLGKEKEAINAIEASWKQKSNYALGVDYLTFFENESPKKRLALARKLAKYHPDTDAASNALVARAAKEAGDSSTARNYLKLALEQAPLKSFYRLMLQIEQSEEQPSPERISELEMRRKTALPDPGWACARCRGEAKQWSMVCVSCGAVDAVEWKDPTPKLIPANK